MDRYILGRLVTPSGREFVRARPGAADDYSLQRHGRVSVSSSDVPLSGDSIPASGHGMGASGFAHFDMVLHRYVVLLLLCQVFWREESKLCKKPVGCVPRPSQPVV